MQKFIKDISKKTLTEAINAIGIHLKGLDTFLTSTNVSGIVLSQDGSIFTFNNKAEQLIGQLTSNTLQRNESFADLFPKHISKGIHSDFYTALQNGNEVVSEHSFRSRNGSQVWFEFLFIKLPFEDATSYILLVIRDITEAKKTSQAWYESRIAYKAMVQNTSDYVSVLDTNGIYKYISPSFKKRFSRGGSIVGKSIFDFVHSKDHTKVQKVLSHRDSEFPKDISMEYRMIDNNGSTVHVETKSVNLVHNPVIQGYVEYTRDISDKKKIENQLKKDAYYDTLTKISNRHGFLKQLEKASTKHSKNKTKFALLFIDLDRFKAVNDTLGHKAGDLLLIDVAKQLAAICNTHNLFLARLGGDEFTILIEHTATDVYCEKIAKLVIETLSHPIKIDLQEVYIGCSIGINIIDPTDSHLSQDDYLRNADKAMYLAKQRGKGKFVVYNKEFDEHNVEVFNSDLTLRKAFDNDEFYVVYQPIIDTQTNEVVMYESNIAWNHEDRGFLLSYEFLTEETDPSIITLLNNFQVDSVTETIKKVHDFKSQRIRVSINIDTKKSQLEMLLKKIKKTAELYSIDPEQYVIELIPMNDRLVHDIAENNDLKELMQDIPIYIDMFAEQASSISSLLKTPFKGVKIDCNHMCNLPVDSKTLVHHQIKILEICNLRSIIYNIDEAVKVDMAKSTGATYIQGSYFGKPLTTLQLLEIV
jgi:diguanylate cyclase (GGDEF)-like protein/PAS domain S-box-containing protein